MPSQPLDQAWNFHPVFDLIESDSQDIGSHTLRTEMQSPPLSEVGVGLGNFGKLFESLGLPADVAIPPLPLLDESDCSKSDDAVLTSPSVEGIQEFSTGAGDRSTHSFAPVVTAPAVAVPFPTTFQRRPMLSPDIESINPLEPETAKVSLQQDSKTAQPASAIIEDQRHSVSAIEVLQAARTKGNVLSFQNEHSARIPASVTIEPIQTRRTEIDDGSSQNETLVTVQSPGTTKKQRRKARRQADQALQEEASNTQEVAVDVSDKSKAKTIPETPTKLPRAQSNTGAKVTPSSPTPALEEGPVASALNLTPRPVMPIRQPSAMAPSTSQTHPLQSRMQPVPWTHGTVQYTHVKMPAPFQYSLAPQYLSQLQPSQLSHGSTTPGLVPRTVRSVTLPRQSHHSGRLPLVPVSPCPAQYSSAPRPAIMIRQQIDRHFHLLETLLVRFPDDRKWLVSPRQLVNENLRAEGIHVFVDASNIMIGFQDMLRNKGVQPYDISFDGLALLMERRRPVAKRALVGSHRVSDPLPATQRLIGLAKDVGYQCDIQEQVCIAREKSSKKKFFNDVHRLGWQRAMQKHSGSGSDSETGAAAAPKTPATPKWVEQGVDELLHLKMCQSMLDTDLPSTMVLATGDGAEAEMSDGFLAHVERALRKGWKVELITWRQQMNGGYRRRTFRQKWGERFTIIELDEYLEDLIDTP